jgi:dipeptidyl aminopeptidase/acylaminoacyl peptidase
MATTSRRAPRPDDVYRLRVPTDPRLSPDGSRISFTVKAANAAFDGYRTAVWTVPADGSEPARRWTLGAKRDHRARWAPDGRTLAFLTDRRPLVEDEPTAAPDREDVSQVHLLPLGGGEASRLTDLPRGVDAYAWSPDGSRLALVSASRFADRGADERSRRRLAKAAPGKPPASDYRFIDTLHFLQNGAGYVGTATTHLWVLDVASGELRRLTDLEAGVDAIDWSPDGSRIAVMTGWGTDHDLRYRGRVLVVDVLTAKATAVAEHPEGVFVSPAFLPDGATVAVAGGLMPAVAYRADIRLFSIDGADAGTDGRDLSGRHDVMPGSSMNSDITIGEGGRLWPTPDGSALLFIAPHRGAMELFRLAVADGALERLTDGRHYLSSFDAVPAAGGLRVAVVRSAATELPEVGVLELAADGRVPGGGFATVRTVTDINAALTAELELIEPVERRVRSDGWDIQGWLVPAGDGTRPTVVQIHGGPHTLYGWSPVLEFQVLAAAGISVYYSNPRGSEGYGIEFNRANIRDWGPGPMRDVMAGVDALVADGLADPARLGVTGGSYGGYLTNWIVGHTDRFAAALTARSVTDMTMLMLSGDLGGTEWPSHEFGGYPWEQPEYFREISPLTYAEHIVTPLLIQHAEQDLRCTITQAEVLFSALRRLGRPVRFMRVPEENHELTRSGKPYRRAENLAQVLGWFRHFLLDGRKGLPPMPKTREDR